MARATPVRRGLEGDPVRGRGLSAREEALIPLAIIDENSERRLEKVSGNGTEMVAGTEDRAALGELLIFFDREGHQRGQLQ